MSVRINTYPQLEKSGDEHGRIACSRVDTLSHASLTGLRFEIAGPLMTVPNLSKRDP